MSNSNNQQHGNESKPRAGTACANHSSRNYRNHTARTATRSQFGTHRIGVAATTRSACRTPLRPCRSRADRPPPDRRLFRPGIHPAVRKVGRRDTPQRHHGL